MSDLAASVTADGYRCYLRRGAVDGEVLPVVLFIDETLYRELAARIATSRHPLKRIVDGIAALRWWRMLIVVMVLLAVFLWAFFLLLLRMYELTAESRHIKAIRNQALLGDVSIFLGGGSMPCEFERATSFS